MRSGTSDVTRREWKMHQSASPKRRTLTRSLSYSRVVAGNLHGDCPGVDQKNGDMTSHPVRSDNASSSAVLSRSASGHLRIGLVVTQRTEASRARGYDRDSVHPHFAVLSTSGIWVGVDGRNAARVATSPAASGKPVVSSRTPAPVASTSELAAKSSERRRRRDPASSSIRTCEEVNRPVQPRYRERQNRPRSFRQFSALQQSDSELIYVNVLTTADLHLRQLSRDRSAQTGDAQSSRWHLERR